MKKLIAILFTILFVINYLQHRNDNTIGEILFMYLKLIGGVGFILFAIVLSIKYHKKVGYSLFDTNTLVNWDNIKKNHFLKWGKNISSANLRLSRINYVALIYLLPSFAINFTEGFLKYLLLIFISILLTWYGYLLFFVWKYKK